MTSIKTISAGALALGLMASSALAQSCEKITFADVGWTDITATTALTTEVLKSIGYETEIKTLALPVTFSALSTDQIDVFLGLWMPSMMADITPYFEAKTIVQSRVNLEGAKYTLATNAAGAAIGLTDFTAIAAYSKDLDSKIYGIEPGNDGNRLILDMIAANAFDLKDIQLVESSEQGMLAQVERLSKRNKPAVFLAWEPHPMNTALEITYLEGGDDFFGPELGGATVATVTRPTLAADCPNIGKFLDNLVFTLEMENVVMGGILNENQSPEAAARAYLQAHPEVLDGWLEGVTTASGDDALAAAKAAL